MIENPLHPPLTETTASMSPEEITEVFQTLFDLYGVLNSEGRIIELRGPVFKETQTDTALLSGQIFSETVFWQSTENTAITLANSVAAAIRGEGSTITIAFRQNANSKVPLELSLVPVGTEEHRKVIVCGRRPAEATSSEGFGRVTEQLLSAAESAEIGIWYWDFNSGQISSTPRCNELLGLPAYEKLTYERIKQAIHPDDREFVIGFLDESRQNGTRYEEEFRVIHPDGDGEWICAEGKSLLGSDGAPPRMMGVVRNITEQKLDAEEVAQVNEREKKARDEAIEANRAKDFFLAFVSHELRAPLNAILGWSKILLTREVDDETRQTALETIERSARVQTKLINDLVDSARVSSGKLRLEYRPTNLYDVVHGSYQSHKPSADAKNIEFTFAADHRDVAVLGDVHRLQQVFGNLLSNAIKFTPEGGKVSIEVVTDPAAAKIILIDNGHGISEEAMPEIFRQFSQAESVQIRGSSGLGLGLSIAKILVERHGGSIKAESSGTGQGSTFTVVLPLADAAKQIIDRQVASDLPDRKALAELRILVVEDDPDSREVLQLHLEQCGATVRSAASAKMAMNELEHWSGRLPDLIISDLAMPEEDGYSLIARIRQLTKQDGGEIPALALSAFTTAESKQKAFEAGFQRYSTKPFDHDLLIKDIKELVKNGHGSM